MTNNPSPKVDDELVALLERAAANLQDEGYPMSSSHVETAIARITDLQARLERYREALEFYAKPHIYKPHPHGPAFDDRDLSFVARKALSDSTEGE